MMRYLLASLVALFTATVTATGQQQQLTPVGYGDLPSAISLNLTDMMVVCQNIPCPAGAQLNSATFSQLPITGLPPIGYSRSTGIISLSIDSTLSVVGGQLHVVAPSISVPNSPLLSGNGSILGSVALGSNLSVSGSFPNQTLNATGAGSGFSGGITVASACTGASCTPVTSCFTYSNGSLSGFASGACSGGGGGASLTGGGGGLTGGGGTITGG